MIPNLTSAYFSNGLVQPPTSFFCLGYISHQKSLFEDDLPFPKVGYVNSLESTLVYLEFHPYVSMDPSDPWIRISRRRRILTRKGRGSGHSQLLLMATRVRDQLTSWGKGSWNPIIYRVWNTSQVTVWDFFHHQYVVRNWWTSRILTTHPPKICAFIRTKNVQWNFKETKFKTTKRDVYQNHSIRGILAMPLAGDLSTSQPSINQPISEEHWAQGMLHELG